MFCNVSMCIECYIQGVTNRMFSGQRERNSLSTVGVFGWLFCVIRKIKLNLLLLYSSLNASDHIYPKPSMIYPHPLSTHNSKSSLKQSKQVGSWWNFHRSFRWMLPPIWHHLQIHQECPCPPRLHKETWRTGGVLTRFLMSDLDETFTDTSCEYFHVYFLLDSGKKHGGQEKSWHGC